MVDTTHTHTQTSSCMVAEELIRAIVAVGGGGVAHEGSPDALETIGTCELARVALHKLGLG